MRTIAGLLAVAALVGSWFACPEGVRDHVLGLIKPSEAAEAGALEMKQVVGQFLDSAPQHLDEDR